MSLDPMPDAATLLRMKQDREARRSRLTISGDPRDAVPLKAALERIEDSTPIARAGIAWPVELRIPWSCLVSDNDKHHARLITVKGAPKAINVITKPYAAAEQRIAALAKERVGDAAPVGFPIRLVARVWMPDARPHDMTNFCKLVHDALEGVVYDNDRWLHDVRWIRAGVDVDAPRAEITISPLTP